MEKSYIFQKLLWLPLILFILFQEKEAKANSNYIQMDPSGMGFIFENGEKFIPIGHNAHRVWRRYWQDDPQTGREYVYLLGARGEDCPDYCGTGCLPQTPGKTYDEWFAELTESGVNSLRVWLGGGSNNWSPGVDAIPIGKYNVADKVICGTAEEARQNKGGYQDKQIDGEDLMRNYPNCRWPNFTSQNCGPYAEKLQKSLITRMLKAGEKYGVKIKFVLFDSGSIEKDENWEKSPYNRLNCWYDRPSKCGPLDNPYDFWTNGNWNTPLFSENTAINYAKQYVSFVIQVWGDSSAIWDWEIWNEIHYAGITWGHEQEMVNWVDKMAHFIRELDAHHRPISVSAYNDSTESTYIKRNQMFSSQNIDFVQWHYYPRDEDAKIENALGVLREIENTYHKPAFIGEFWPWTAQEGPLANDVFDPFIEETLKQNPPHESFPYRPTLGRLWLGLISSGTSVAHRWHEKGLDGLSYINFHQIYQPIKKFINQIDWQNWNYQTSQPWENYINGNLGLKVGRGDKNQVMLLLEAKGDELNLTVNALENGNYQLEVFDFITGNTVEKKTNLTVSSGQLTTTLDFSNSRLDVNKDGYDRKRIGVVLIKKQKTSLSLRSLLLQWGKSGEADLNNDGKVNCLDFGKIRILTF